MAKISPVSIKYMIHATFTAEGALEKPDIIGAIFGQTEGLLGADLEMRDLQKEGKIGRIEVELERRDRKTMGKIDIPTALDQSETTLIAAAVETIERIGPSDAQIEVIDGDLLRLKNNKRCNLVRDYENFVVYVTTPNLTEIRNASGQDIIGEGVLEFPSLTLVSDTSFDSEGGPAQKSGNFHLEVESTNMVVRANGKSVFYLSGSTQNLNANFANEGPRLESRDLLIQNFVFSQTSANKMIVNPQASIKGSIFGTGDVISVNRPSVVEVEELYTGRLIFED